MKNPYFAKNKYNNGNDKDYAPFSRLILELVAMQKHIDILILKYNIFSCKKTYVTKLFFLLSNNMRLELNII